MNVWPMDTPFNVADLSLQPPASFPELYQELWWYSGSSASVSTNTPGGNCIQKGATNFVSETSALAKIYTHSSSWSASTKFSFECALYSSSASYTASVELWDITSNTAVSGSTVSTTATTFTVVRSGQFTLTPGHIYGITAWSSVAAGYVYITDASLIIFPPAGSVSPSLSSISLANPSGGSLKEAYIPLWVYSSGYAQTTSTTFAYLTKGTANVRTASGFLSQNYLHALSSAWPPNQKFALEVSMYTSGNTANAVLVDINTSTNVSASSVSTTSSTFTVVRSGSFTLTPGHSYAVSISTGNASFTTYLTKAHLVAIGG